MTQISILPPNSTPLERALEASFAARLAALPLPVGQMMNHATCPAAFLPWLAWALSVDEWSPDWTEQTQRAAIAASIGVHRRKGTVAALRAAIAAAGYGEVEVIERYALARHDGTRRHNGGNDNYAKGANDPLGPFWADTMVKNGITSLRTGAGVDPVTREAWYRCKVSGAFLSSTTAEIGYISVDGSQIPVVPDQEFTASARLSVSGTSFGSGVRVIMRDTINTRSGNLVTAGPQISIRTQKMPAGATTNRFAVVIVGTVGLNVDCEVTIQGAQFELSDQRNLLTNLPFIHGSPDHWAEYRLKIARPVTIAQAQQIRRIAEGVAPARCHLKEITYPAAQHLHNGTIAHNGIFAHGAA